MAPMIHLVWPLTYSSQGDYPLRDLAAYAQGIFTYSEEKMMESVRIVLQYFNERNHEWFS